LVPSAKRRWRERGDAGTDSALISLSLSIPIRPPPFSPLVPVVNRFLCNAAHGIVSFLLRGNAHLHQQREPASLVIVQSVLRRSGHLVLLLVVLVRGFA
jgi:hypothetical protein